MNALQVTDVGAAQLCRLITYDNTSLTVISLQNNTAISPQLNQQLRGLLRINKQYTAHGAWAAVRQRHVAAPLRHWGGVTVKRLPADVHERLVVALMLSKCRKSSEPLKLDRLPLQVDLKFNIPSKDFLLDPGLAKPHQSYTCAPLPVHVIKAKLPAQMLDLWFWSSKVELVERSTLFGADVREDKIIFE